ncbi:nucleotidyltransferase [Terribacillus saccharophilus]|uniref:nucleotidyltransferase n=1 Tax=Terribacillus saccharophilus TaxID=361277 RepID=UPI003981FC57
MVQIKAIGRFCMSDEQGYIVNEASLERIHRVYRDVIRNMIHVYKTQLGANLHSIYIRGSIPRGVGISGVSDLDTICLTKYKVADLDLTWVEQAENELNQNFDCVNGVELSFHHIDEICITKSFTIIPFMIKTHSVCVYGDDVRNHLPSYKADHALANDHIFNLQTLLNIARDELQGNEDIEDILDCCVWIMKIMVRGGLALVLEKEKQYTRDLYPAYKAFSKYFADQEQNMRQALDYAINPITDTEQLTTFLDEFGGWMIKESEKWLAAHNPSRIKNMLMNL